MAACQGEIPITTKVDESMRDFVDDLAESRGISRSELLRRMLEEYAQEGDGKRFSRIQSKPAQNRNDGEASKENFQTRIVDIESALESQQEELKSLREETRTQKSEVAELSETSAASQRVEKLQDRIERVTDGLHYVAPRVEALLQVSELEKQGKCPSCGDDLTEEQSLTDLGEASAIKCTGCGRVAGHRR